MLIARAFVETVRFDNTQKSTLTIVDFLIVIDVLLLLLLILSYYHYKRMCIYIIVYMLQLTLFMNTMKQAA